MKKLLKVKKINFIIIFLILLINAFCLPSLGIWNIYPKNKFITENSDLANFKHPQIPMVKQTVMPAISAGNFILIDNDTNTILASKNPNIRVYPASTTKLATALTALNIYPLDDTVIINEEYKEGKIMNLQIGEKITIKSLVTALLVYSANDSAFNLAKHHTDGINGFVQQMNLIAQKYNLKGTHFTNFDGIHNPDHYSTAYDLSQLARIAIKNPTIREVVRNKKITVTDVDNKIQHQLESTNELLDIVPEIEGLKTGWTPEASGCFVGLINIGGHKLISVVAQSPDRFQDTKTLVDWAKQNITWQDYQ